MDTIFLNNIDWVPLLLTFKLALVTTILLVLIGIPIAYALAFSKSKLKLIFETLISMPLVLPPTVLGFYLLLVFSPNSAFGSWLNHFFGIQFAFSFTGIVIASMIYSLPFMVQPIQNGLQSLPKTYIETAQVLGKSKLEILKQILLPNSKSSIISAAVLTFAHTIGEFGVVLMIGGSVPNQTKVASIAVYEKVESLNYTAAHQYALILFIVSFSILLSVYAINNSNKNWIMPFFKK